MSPIFGACGKNTTKINLNLLDAASKLWYNFGANSPTGSRVIKAKIKGPKPFYYLAKYIYADTSPQTISDNTMREKI